MKEDGELELAELRYYKAIDAFDVACGSVIPALKSVLKEAGVPSKKRAPLAERLRDVIETMIEKDRLRAVANKAYSDLLEKQRGALKKS